MISKDQGKSMMKKVVSRYSIVEDDTRLIKSLSEGDIATKFVLPMLEALNWDIYKVTKKGPEVHEKAYRQKSDVGKGLPDITLKSENGTVFVEVKKPPLGEKGMADLGKYADADLIILTSFEHLKVCTRSRHKSVRCELNYKKYPEKFDHLWKILSNTKEAKRTRAAYKARR